MIEDDKILSDFKDISISMISFDLFHSTSEKIQLHDFYNQGIKMTDIV